MILFLIRCDNGIKIIKFKPRKVKMRLKLILSSHHMRSRAKLLNVSMVFHIMYIYAAKGL